MEFLCPDCMGPLKTSDGKIAFCTLHGGRYEILFSRWQAPPPQSIPQAGMCARHPAVAAIGACGRCAAPICGTCGFPQADGSQWCPDCATGKTPAPSAPAAGASPRPGAEEAPPAVTVSASVAGSMAEKADPELQEISLLGAGNEWTAEAVAGARQELAARGVASPTELQEPAPVAATPAFVSDLPAVGEGVMCTRHPEVQAVETCDACQSAICATCDFAFPGGAHLCPGCATAPADEMGSKRKTYLRWSYALAVWCTLGMAFLFFGSMAATTPAEEEAMGAAFAFLVFIPSIIGTALGVAAIDRRLNNPASVWVAAIWNGVFLAGFLLLSVLGLFMA